MKVSHILYKVENLDKAVEQYRQDGFVVEYGVKNNPYNALVYFSEGPYLELFCNSNMPKWVKLLLKLVGKAKMVTRMNTWEKAKDGLIAVCLENNKDNLEEEKAILKQHQQRFFAINNKRLDTQERLLRYKVLFPDEMHIPFLMTCFNIDPKPKNFVHPNGVKSITSISFGTQKSLMPIIEELCDDPILKLYEGSEVKDLEYEVEQ